jgi:hypothetical protein
MALYFNSVSFSPRFGDTFFTFEMVENDHTKVKSVHEDSQRDYSHAKIGEDDDGEVDDTCKLFALPAFCKPSEHIEYLITVKRGRKLWKVSKRYNDFLKFRHDVIEDIHYSQMVNKESIMKQLQGVKFPTKTWFNVLSDATFLETRRSQLCDYLHSSFECLSVANRMQGNVVVEEFLNMNKM